MCVFGLVVERMVREVLDRRERLFGLMTNAVFKLGRIGRLSF